MNETGHNVNGRGGDELLRYTCTMHLNKRFNKPRQH